MKHYLLLAIDHKLILIELITIVKEEAFKCSSLREQTILGIILVKVLIEVGYDQNYESIRVETTLERLIQVSNSQELFQDESQRL